MHWGEIDRGKSGFAINRGFTVYPPGHYQLVNDIQNYISKRLSTDLLMLFDSVNDSFLAVRHYTIIHNMPRVPLPNYYI